MVCRGGGAPSPRRLLPSDAPSDGVASFSRAMAPRVKGRTSPVDTGYSDGPPNGSAEAGPSGHPDVPRAHDPTLSGRLSSTTRTPMTSAAVWVPPRVLPMHRVMHLRGVGVPSYAVRYGRRAMGESYGRGSFDPVNRSASSLTRSTEDSTVAARRPRLGRADPRSEASPPGCRPPQ